MTMCNIHIHILSTHSVLLYILTVIKTYYTPYVHILHYVHIYTHNNMSDSLREKAIPQSASVASDAAETSS